jgi:hypothetical protein
VLIPCDESEPDGCREQVVESPTTPIQFLHTQPRAVLPKNQARRMLP